MFIQKYQHLYPVEKMCQVFRVSKSSYYKWTHKKPTKQHIRNTMLKTEIEKYTELVRADMEVHE